MTPPWLRHNKYDPSHLVPEAALLDDTAYVLGMLRLVIPRIDYGSFLLSEIVLAQERGVSLLDVSRKHPQLLSNGKPPFGAIARCSYSILRNRGEDLHFAIFAKFCDAVLRTPADFFEGDAWCRAVNQIVLDA